MAYNIEAEVAGNILIVKINLDEEFGPSKSGKTVLVASTQGNHQVPDKPGYMFGVNVYKTKGVD